MSPHARRSAVAAAALTVVLAATWDAGGGTTDAERHLDGAELFRAKGCATCHDGPVSAATIGIGFPSLADAAEWAGDRREGLDAEAYLVESIAAPDVFVSPAFHGGTGPTTGMPRLDLGPDEIDAIVDHLLGG